MIRRNRRRSGVMNRLRRTCYYCTRFTIIRTIVVSVTVVALAVLDRGDLLRTYGGVLNGAPNSLSRESTTEQYSVLKHPAGLLDQS
jgi:hypothetical protein